MTNQYTIMPSKNECYKFSEGTQFSESLRIDISNVDINIYNISINKKGDVLLFVNGEIIKINLLGEEIFRANISLDKRFYPLHNPRIGVFEGSDDFFINNFILTNNNELIELALVLENTKSKKLIDGSVNIFVHCTKNQKYYIFFNQKWCRYHLNGTLDKELDLQENKYFGLITATSLLYYYKDNAMLFFDFDLNLVCTIPMDKGYSVSYFSNSLNYGLSFGYNTKSFFYDFKKNTKQVIWAHPTYIKNYKELMYNDTEHNFGMNPAKFSSDEKYIVGGAWHGKYVAWRMPSLERTELIPNPDALKVLPYHYYSSRKHDGTWTEIEEKPELIKIQNQVFLKNRGNNMRGIFFFENSNLFITEIITRTGCIALVWNRNFENTKFFEFDGQITFPYAKYLLKFNKDNIVIFL